mgnify:CR=1 FL=1
MGYALVIALLSIRNFVILGLVSVASIRADQKAEPTQVKAGRVQSVEAVTLDDQLDKEMGEYEQRFREFRSSLRAKYPRGEDRIAAIEEWEKNHKLWKDGWERRMDHLEKIWNWGPEGKPVPTRILDDLSTATGQVTAAISKIRREVNGNGLKTKKIEEWRNENKALLEQAESELEVLSPPPASKVVTMGTNEEIALSRAKSVLDHIYQRLMKLDMEDRKVEMNDPNSEYSKQKAVVMEKCEQLLADSRKRAKKTKSK